MLQQAFCLQTTGFFSVLASRIEIKTRIPTGNRQFSSFGQAFLTLVISSSVKLKMAGFLAVIEAAAAPEFEDDEAILSPFLGRCFEIEVFFNRFLTLGRFASTKRLKAFRAEIRVKKYFFPFFLQLCVSVN